MLGMVRQTRGYELYGSPIHQTYYFAILVTPLYLQVLELGSLHVRIDQVDRLAKENIDFEHKMVIFGLL